MTNDYFEYVDQSERTLEDLLVWWGNQEPFEHTDDCDGAHMHCCLGKNYGACSQSLEATDFAFRWAPEYKIPVAFRAGPGEPPVVLEAGDRIYYRGNYVYELVRNDTNP